MYVRDDLSTPVLLPIGAPLPATNRAGNDQTQAGAPSLTAAAMIFSTPDASQNPVPGGGIFTIADQVAGPAASMVLAGPTADAGIKLTQSGMMGQGAARTFTDNPLVAWGLFGVLSWMLFGKRR